MLNFFESLGSELSSPIKLVSPFDLASRKSLVAMGLVVLTMSDL